LDAELKTHLEGMESRLDGRIDSLSEQFANLVAGEISAMHREMRDNLERIDERLNRHGEMLANGTRALGALVDYVERADANYARLLREMDSLRARVAALENKVA